MLAVTNHMTDPAHSTPQLNYDDDADFGGVSQSAVSSGVSPTSKK
jgi:hypothetical protein